MADNTSPISAAGQPAAGGDANAHASTLKLKPVIRKPGEGGPRPTIGLKKPAPAAAAPAPAPEPAKEPAPTGGALAQLKGVTQKLKGVTQQIPQQAILHKTGIIADQDLTEAQKQASKSRTARISLSDALGVAPVQNDAAPMKTIRIKRPAGLQPAGGEAEAAEGEPAPTATQRKTLKISRPGAGGAKPTGKFGLKKPGAADGGEGGDVADIPDMPASAPARFAPVGGIGGGGGNTVPDVPSGLLVFDMILQVAACAAVGFLGWLLYTDLNTLWF